MEVLHRTPIRSHHPTATQEVNSQTTSIYDKMSTDELLMRVSLLMRKVCSLLQETAREEKRAATKARKLASEQKAATEAADAFKTAAFSVAQAVASYFGFAYAIQPNKQTYASLISQTVAPTLSAGQQASSQLSSSVKTLQDLEINTASERLEEARSAQQKFRDQQSELKQLIEEANRNQRSLTERIFGG